MFKAFLSLEYHDPKRAIQLAIVQSGIRSLRLETRGGRFSRPERKPELEQRQAAFFAYARATVQKDESVRFSMVPTQDDAADSILRFGRAESLYYFEPVQLKELVPQEVNPSASLDDLLAKIRVIAECNESLSIAVNLNREEISDLRPLLDLKLGSNKLWLFGLSESNVGFIVSFSGSQAVVTEFAMPKLPSSLTKLA